jgi:dihydroorotate dehydrogenase/Pyruvate/2-oxoacid:ferredoxin oxidoreductase delta subunit
MKSAKTTGGKDTSVDVAGVKFRTPVGVGSVGGPPMRREHLTPDLYVGIFLKHIAAGAGFICLPSTIHVPDALLSDLQTRAKPLIPPKASSRPPIFLRASEKASIYSLAPSGNTPQISAGIFRNSTSTLIKKLREQKPKDIPLIANVSGLGFFPETFVAGARAHEEAAVDLIELNLSSPATVQATLDEGVQGYFEKDFPLAPPGLFLGDQPDLVEKVTREVSRAVSIPVGVKISAETGFPRVIALARRIRDAGGKFITCSNFGLTVVPPDICNKGKSIWPHLEDGPMATIGGEWLRPLVYKQIASIARFAPGIQIIGCGGMSKPEHVVESIMLGATAVQMVTPILMQGRKLITRDVRFLEKYMEEQAYATPEDFRGLALGHIKPAKTLHSTYDERRVLAKVDTEKCKGCGICSDSICLAISVEGTKAKVSADMCAGCGMCVAVCPHEAVKLE